MTVSGGAKLPTPRPGTAAELVGFWPWSLPAVTNGDVQCARRQADRNMAVELTMPEAPVLLFALRTSKALYELRSAIFRSDWRGESGEWLEWAQAFALLVAMSHASDPLVRWTNHRGIWIAHLTARGRELALATIHRTGRSPR